MKVNITADFYPETEDQDPNDGSGLTIQAWERIQAELSRMGMDNVQFEKVND